MGAIQDHIARSLPGKTRRRGTTQCFCAASESNPPRSEAAAGKHDPVSKQAAATAELDFPAVSGPRQTLRPIASHLHADGLKQCVPPRRKSVSRGGTKCPGPFTARKRLGLFEECPQIFGHAEDRRKEGRSQLLALGFQASFELSKAWSRIEIARDIR